MNLQAGDLIRGQKQRSSSPEPLLMELGTSSGVVTWCPSLGASRWGFKPGYLTAQLPEAARCAYTQSAAVGTALAQPPTPQGPATTSLQHPKGHHRAPVWGCLSVCPSPSPPRRKHCLTIALLAPARFPAPSCQVYPAFSSSPPPAPLLSGHVCVSVSCRLSSPSPRCSLPTPSSPRGCVLSQS